MFKDLVMFGSCEKLLSAPRTEISKTSDGVMWMEWVQDEIRRRTGYCIWVCVPLSEIMRLQLTMSCSKLLDCTLAYYFEDRPLLSLDDGQAALPAHEKLWQTSSAEDWKQLWDNTAGTFHFTYLLKELY